MTLLPYPFAHSLRYALAYGPAEFSAIPYQHSVQATKQRNSRALENLSTRIKILLSADEISRWGKANTFSNNFSCHTVYMLLGPLAEELNRTEISQPFLSALSIAIDFNVFRHPLPGCLSGWAEMPVDDFLFQNGKEAFAPGIISWFACARIILFPPIPGSKLLSSLRRILASTITVKDTTFWNIRESENFSVNNQAWH